jgi:hypothetical protein
MPIDSLASGCCGHFFVPLHLFQHGSHLTSQKPAATKATTNAAEHAPSVDVSMLEGRPPDRARRKGPKLGTRCKMGCYVCSRTRSSQFHRWRDSSLASFIEKIEAQRPKSEEICDRCLQRVRRKSCQAMSSEVRSSRSH